MLWKAKVCAAVVAILSVAATLAIVHSIPATYRAETVIVVDSQKIPDRYVSSTISTDIEDRLATIREQIMSSGRLKRIIEDYGLYREERATHVEEEILDMMRRDIEIRLERSWTGNRPGAFRISYRGPVPSVVAEVTNRLASLYIEENLKTREVQAEGTSEFLDHQLQDAKKRLSDLERAVSSYKVVHNGELPQQENSLSAALARLQLELQGNQDAINRAQQTKLVFENTLGLAKTTDEALRRAATERELPGGATAAAGGPLKPKASEILEAQVKALRLRYKDEHPDLKLLQQQLAAAKLQEEQERVVAERAAEAPQQPDRAAGAGKSRSFSPELVQSRERVATLESQLELAGQEIEAREAERKRILGELADAQNRLQRLPIREQEMAALTRDYEISKSNYRSLLDKKLSAEMAADMERRQKAERFTVLDAAQVPEKPFRPNRPLLAGAGSLLGLVFAVTVSIGKELRKQLLLGEWELPKGIVVLGRIPHIDPDPGEEIASPVRRRALIASAAVFVLGIAVAGIYLSLRSAQ